MSTCAVCFSSRYSADVASTSRAANERWLDGDALPDGEVQADGSIDGLVDAPSDAPSTVADAPCADDDDDGVCNSMDTWPCGAPPTPPGIADHARRGGHGDRMTISLSNTALTGGQRLYTVAPGATFTVTANYSIIDCICTGLVRDSNPKWSRPRHGEGVPVQRRPVEPVHYRDDRHGHAHAHRTDDDRCVSGPVPPRAGPRL